MYSHEKDLRRSLMEAEKILEYAKILNECNLNILEITEGDTKIRLVSGQNRGQATTCCQPAVQGAAVNLPSSAKPIDFNNLYELKSPMVGVFYSAPSPDSAPFVKIGDKVTKGSVLCIIEAMKILNEICADRDGEIVDICAQNEQIVEYGQTLFKIF
jgi:acetyl-CoA carboxylase biotin carboxyl carrier protein